MSKQENVVYSKNVVEFVTVALEFCTMAENSARYTKKDFIQVAVKMLPLLYLKVSMLPETKQILDDDLEESVDEFAYEKIRSSIRNKLTRHDDYLEVFKEDMQHSEEPIIANISEDLADIYQDLRNFCESYRIGVDEIMNDAITNVYSKFKEYWGQRLVNTLRALHCVLYSGEDLTDETQTDKDDNRKPTDDWYTRMIQQRQKDI